jgi:hypothetical protein
VCSEQPWLPLPLQSKLTQHRFAKQFWVCTNNCSLNTSINPKAAWQTRTRGSAGQGSREETRTPTLLTQRNKEVSQVKPDLLHCVNSSNPRSTTRNTNLKIIYIYKLFRHIYTYIYIRIKHTQIRKLAKRNHDMSDLFQTTAASRLRSFFQAGIVIAFDTHRSCPTPTTPLRQDRGCKEVSPLWTPRMHSSWSQVVKRHLQDWTLTEL